MKRCSKSSSSSRKKQNMLITRCHIHQRVYDVLLLIIGQFGVPKIVSERVDGRKTRSVSLNHTQIACDLQRAPFDDHWVEKNGLTGWHHKFNQEALRRIPKIETRSPILPILLALNLNSVFLVFVRNKSSSTAALLLLIANSAKAPLNMKQLKI